MGADRQLGLSLQIMPGTVAASIFGGYFQVRPSGAIRRDDNDAAHRYGGEVLNGVTGAVAELQRNLARIGYFCGAADGDFGLVTEMALRMFKQHMFSGAPNEQRGRWPPRSRGGRDAETCSREVTPAPVA